MFPSTRDKMISNAKNLNSISTSTSRFTLHFPRPKWARESSKGNSQLSNSFWTPRAPNCHKPVSSCLTMLSLIYLIPWNTLTLVLSALESGQMASEMNWQIGLKIICQSSHPHQFFIGMQASRKSKSLVEVLCQEMPSTM